MPDLTTETRTYVGGSGNHAFDGFAGFRRGQPYQLSYEWRGDGTVAVQLDHHAHVGEGRGRWW